MTKRNSAIVESYKSATHSELYEVYDRYSSAKAKAFDYCKGLCAKKNGNGLRILSANTFVFTAAFTYEENGKSYLMYITPSNDLPIELD